MKSSARPAIGSSSILQLHLAALLVAARVCRFCNNLSFTRLFSYVRLRLKSSENIERVYDWISDMSHKTKFDSDKLGGLYDRPGFMLRRCLQATGSLFEESCKDLDLTQGQYDVLHILRHLGTIDQDELAQALGLDRATTGAIVAGLERKDLIKRWIKTADRRKRVIKLTDAGTSLFLSAEPAAIEARKAFFSKLSSAEQQIFMDLLRKIALTTKTHVKAQLKTDWD